MSIRSNQIAKLDEQIQEAQNKINKLQKRKKYLQSVDRELENKGQRQHYARYCAIAIAKLLEIDPRLRSRIDTFLQVMGTNQGLNFLPFNPKGQLRKVDPFSLKDNNSHLPCGGDHE